MVTGSQTGTYIKFGNDIAGVAKTVGLEILVKDSQGSIDNIKRINSKENANFRHRAVGRAGFSQPLREPGDAPGRQPACG